MRKITTLISFLLITFILGAQSPKREFRSTWLTTVWGNDWPKNTIRETGNTSDIKGQKDLMIRILDSLVSANANVVCFQIRGRCDAMYNSKYEPWSTDLVATRDMDPGYDPLAFVIEEGHKRGLEVHAWMNPFRYETVANQWTGQAGDYRTEHPDWILTGSHVILNPGLPEVRQRIVDIIKDVIAKYDIDGILFDDYFYAENIPNTEDAIVYATYNPDGLSQGDWRRSNINAAMKEVYNAIQETKPYVRFGISPAGIWGASADVATQYGLKLPSGIGSGYQYNGIYSDPVAWLQQGSIDYISPQVYWLIGENGKDYSILTPWWSNTAHHFGKHCYISHSISDMTATLKSMQYDDKLQGLTELEKMIYIQNTNVELRTGIPFGPSEMLNQIQINRDVDKNDASGSIFFATTKFYTTKDFISKLKQNKYQHKALPPAIHWKEKFNPGTVSNIILNGRTLSWNPVSGNFRYAVYAIPLAKINDPSVFNVSDYYLGLSYTPSFTVPNNVNLADVKFAISVLDRYANEYAPVIMGETSQSAQAPTLIYPDDKQEILMPEVFKFKWNAVPNAISYTLDIALDANFTNNICSRELYQNEISTDSIFPLAPNHTYYWRVKAKTVGSESSYAEVRSINPVFFTVLSPENYEKKVSLRPVISFKDMGPGCQYTMEVGSDANFNAVIYSYTGTSNTCQLPENLLIGLKKYYVRAKTEYQGKKLETPVFNFTTLQTIPDVPVIISPVDGSSVDEADLTVKWTEDNRAVKFRIELCSSADFPARQLKINQVNPFIYETTYTSLVAGNYYVRARADYYTQIIESGMISSASTAWSDTIMVKFNLPTGIDDARYGELNAFVRSINGEKQLVLNLNESSFISVSMYTISGIKLNAIYNNLNILPGEYVITIPTEKLPKGFYLLTIENQNGKQAIKFFN